MTVDTRSLARPVETCRVCGSGLRASFSLGDQYLSSMFPASLEYHDEVPRLPLDLTLCVGDGRSGCGLLQLGHELDLSAMYDAYPYTSATNAAMPKVLEDVANSGRALGHLEKGDIVLDIGCNDGTLLAFFKDDPYELVGIDPAKNVAFSLRPERASHVRDFFSADAYARVTKKKAKLIFSIAMFYHLHDPTEFTRQVASCLADDGVFVVQMAYLPAMIKTNMYDNIVHEHAGYYATHHMRWIMEKAGLEIFDVLENDVYGGSFRVFAKKKGCARFPPTDRYQKNLAAEVEFGIYDPKTYEAFAGRVAKTRADLRRLCSSIRESKKTIWVYGASTKGNTILQYCGLGSREIEAAADASPFKFGKYVVGADIVIRDEDTMRKAKPDYLLALPYSFVGAFMKREADLVARGTKFIVPLPNVQVLPA